MIRPNGIQDAHTTFTFTFNMGLTGFDSGYKVVNLGSNQITGKYAINDYTMLAA